MKQDGISPPHRIAHLFHDALAIANLETVFAGEQAGFAGYPRFNAYFEEALPSQTPPTGRSFPCTSW